MNQHKVLYLKVFGFYMSQLTQMFHHWINSGEKLCIKAFYLLTYLKKVKSQVKVSKIKMYGFGFVWHETRFVESGIFNDSEPTAFTKGFYGNVYSKMIQSCP